MGGLGTLWEAAARRWRELDLLAEMRFVADRADAVCLQSESHFQADRFWKLRQIDPLAGQGNGAAPGADANRGLLFERPRITAFETAAFSARESV